jgi:hypothetical protein
MLPDPPTVTEPSVLEPAVPEPTVTAVVALTEVFPAGTDVSDVPVEVLPLTEHGVEQEPGPAVTVPPVPTDTPVPTVTASDVPVLAEPPEVLPVPVFTWMLLPDPQLVSHDVVLPVVGAEGEPAETVVPPVLTETPAVIDALVPVPALVCAPIAGWSVPLVVLL